MQLSDEEQSIQRLAREFATNEIEPVAVELEREGQFPWSIVEKAAEADLLAPTLPVEYGGAGLGLVPELLIQEEFHRVDPGIAESVLAATFGCDVIVSNGSETQIEEYVRPATHGELITGVGMTEPESGSDFASIQTAAERENDEYVINGEKVFISNGSIADAIVLFARTSSPEKPHRGITGFVIDTERDGFEQTPMEGYLGPDTVDLGQLYLDDVRVPVEARLGEEGEGFYQAMEFMDESRVSVAAASVGVAQGALDHTIEYVTDREQFGQSVSEYQAVRHRLADLATRIEATRAFVYSVARDIEADRLADRSARPAMAKLLATELAEEVASEAIQLHGGYGVFDEYRVESFFRATKGPQIYEGTSEIMREVISESLFDRT
ncbi:MAG: acyl-CoA dehydrogenase family protein [Halobacteriales archaeon]